MIHDIEHLHAELYVEVLRDSLDVSVLEHGEVQIGHAGADNSIAASITAEIETLQIGYRAAIDTIRAPKLSIGSGRNGEALRFDVKAGGAWIRRRGTSRRHDAVWKSKIVVVECISRVISRPPGWRKRHAVAGREDQPEFPSFGGPLGRSAPGFGRRNFPGAIHHQRASNVEIGKTAGQFHIEPVQAGNRIPECVAS